MQAIVNLLKPFLANPIAVAALSTIIWLAYAGQVRSAVVYFYVDSSVGTHNNGGSQNFPFKTIQRAVNAAHADTTGDAVQIFIKAGNYGLANDTSGVGASPSVMDSDGIVIMKSSVRLVGYKTSVSDLNLGNHMPTTYTALQTLLPNIHVEMPQLSGGNRAEEIGINVMPACQNVWIHNLAVREFQTGILLGASTNYCSIKNVVACLFGRPDVPVDDEYLPGSYDGWALNIFGQFHTIDRCIVLNSAQDGFSIHASNCTIQNCRAYSNESQMDLSMDYYFLLCAYTNTPASNNQITNCHAERHMDPVYNAEPPHPGHGFVIQAFANSVPADNETATNNTFTKCYTKSIGEPILLRGRGVYGNTFSICDFDWWGSISYTMPAWGEGAITAYSPSKGPAGTSPNKLTRIRNRNAKSAVLLGGHELELQDNPTQPFGLVFHNCIFDSCEIAVNLSWYQDNVGVDTVYGTEQDATGLEFTNCTFIANPSITTYFFWANREGGGMFTNCIIQNFDHHFGATVYDDPPKGRYVCMLEPHGFTFFNCRFKWSDSCFDSITNFFNQNVLSTNIGGSTIFLSTSTSYELSYGTNPCVNVGAQLPQGFPTLDFDGTARIQDGQVDVGAQERPPH